MAKSSGLEPGDVERWGRDFGTAWLRQLSAPAQDNGGWKDRAQAFIVKNFLVLASAVAVALALAYPAPGILLGSWKIGPFKLTQTANVITIFVVSGMTLKTEDAVAALDRKGRPAFFFGTVSILFLTSLAATAVLQIPFAVPEFSYGLAVFCVVPTTLSSGVTLVALAGGNDALALLLTVVTNVAGVATVPYLLKAIFSEADVSIDALGLLVKLLVTVLAPLIAGKLLRDYREGVVEWTRKNRTPLSLTNSTMLTMIMWLALSSARDDVLRIATSDIVAITLACAAVHVAFLAFNYYAVQYLKIPLREAAAVVIMGSEKAPPIALAVLSYLTSLGNFGLMSVPCIISQIVQLFMDSYVAALYAEKTAALPPAPSIAVNRESEMTAYVALPHAIEELEREDTDDPASQPP